MATVGVWPVVKSDYKPTDTVELGATYALGSVLGNAQRSKEVLTLSSCPGSLALSPLRAPTQSTYLRTLSPAHLSSHPDTSAEGGPQRHL